MFISRCLCNIYSVCIRVKCRYSTITNGLESRSLVAVARSWLLAKRLLIKLEAFNRDISEPQRASQILKFKNLIQHQLLRTASPAWVSGSRCRYPVTMSKVLKERLLLVGYRGLFKNFSGTYFHQFRLCLRQLQVRSEKFFNRINEKC